jgi:succinate dehydrogenase/fumarate reductase flavoprotein subunit
MRLSDEARTSDKAKSLELESALSVRNLALLGRLLATAALNREESRGAHYRLDFPETDEANWRRVTRLERADSEAIAFHSDPVKDLSA